MVNIRKSHPTGKVANTIRESSHILRKVTNTTTKILMEAGVFAFPRREKQQPPSKGLR
jgi:hypothetical protein